jgi:hypothetical protein
MTCIVSLPGAGLVIQWFGLRDKTSTAHCTRKLTFRKYDISKIFQISNDLYRKGIFLLPSRVIDSKLVLARKSESYKIKLTIDSSKLSQYNIGVIKILWIILEMKHINRQIWSSVCMRLALNKIVQNTKEVVCVRNGQGPGFVPFS